MKIKRILLLLLVTSNYALATTVFPVSLENMSKRADIIFYGKTISNEAKMDEASNRVVTFTTFEIIENIKGTTDATHTIKQVGGQLPGSKFVYRIHGVPRFTLGEEYIVFLPAKSTLGFSSPIGLGQGKYSVYKKNGIKMVNKDPAVKNMVIQDKSKTGFTNQDEQTLNILNPVESEANRTSLTEFIKTVSSLAGK